MINVRFSMIEIVYTVSTLESLRELSSQVQQMLTYPIYLI